MKLTPIVNVNLSITCTRRAMLSMLMLPFTVACTNSLRINSSDPMARMAPFVKKNVVWTTNDYIDFLSELPPSGLLALKKSLELLPADATASSLKGSKIDLIEINTSLCQNASWFGFCRNPATLDYHSLVITSSDQAKVDAEKLKSASTFEAEHLLMAKVYSEIEKDFNAKWAKMTFEERKKVLNRADPNGQLKDHAVIAASAGSAAIGALSGAIALSGFSAYIAATTALGAATAAIGTTLPFAAYTSMTTAISVISGPVGWIAIGAATLFGLVLANRPDSKKVTSFVLTIHALKLDAIRASER